MKTRIVIIIILLAILAGLLTKNDERIMDLLLGTINPIKQKYKNFTQNIEDKSQSYIFQKESIEKLSRENRILRKRLLEQTHYIKQVKDIYDVLPQLKKLPAHNISITETISYVKLNSFTQIILTKPKEVHEGKLYGLIQGTVAAGVALVKNNQLYGYLTSDEKCRFSVFIGRNSAPGIAMGLSKNEMIIKFIPKWHKIRKGDKVVTSGLDNIFFANVPVGIVSKIEIQSAYKVAYIKTYSDVFHPKTFFLINDPKATLARNFDRFLTRIPKEKECIQPADLNLTDTNTTDMNGMFINSDRNRTSDNRLSEGNLSVPVISSIPTRIDQTQEEVIEPEVPIEPHTEPEPEAKKKHIIQRKKKRVNQSLDLF
ncbi:rod shape-determining protein MreC [Sulfurovum lithotrophicum]|uniref:Rod shape-determining protein MreC n=1 Tax=Sulfurovum lithotrophicum TaxID=206403 RepID=A0A7U4M0R8_9BACT|nr:rod shape-determining protein MreC [Sulfurovum lithotrophicum]AKF24723.1 rod shape-determining protein MreC [Sulfurovum lithotrophicum]